MTTTTPSNKQQPWPKLVLAHVLQYLPAPDLACAAALCCRQWHDLVSGEAGDRLFWKQLVMSGFAADCSSDCCSKCPCESWRLFFKILHEFRFAFNGWQGALPFDQLVALAPSVVAASHEQAADNPDRNDDKKKMGVGALYSTTASPETETKTVCFYCPWRNDKQAQLAASEYLNIDCNRIEPAVHASTLIAVQPGVEITDDKKSVDFALVVSCLDTQGDEPLGRTDVPAFATSLTAPNMTMWFAVHCGVLPHLNIGNKLPGGWGKFDANHRVWYHALLPNGAVFSGVAYFELSMVDGSSHMVPCSDFYQAAIQSGLVGWDAEKQCIVARQPIAVLVHWRPFYSSDYP